MFHTQIKTEKEINKYFLYGLIPIDPWTGPGRRGHGVKGYWSTGQITALK